MKLISLADYSDKKLSETLQLEVRLLTEFEHSENIKIEQVLNEPYKVMIKEPVKFVDGYFTIGRDITVKFEDIKQEGKDTLYLYVIIVDIPTRDVIRCRDFKHIFVLDKDITFDIKAIRNVKDMPDYTQYVNLIKDAQELVREFAERNGWEDVPNIDKFDHMHEELLEMSQHLRYLSKEERIKSVSKNKEIFVDGIGDLFFGVCRLANQLDVDVEDAFNQAKISIFERYSEENREEHSLKRTFREES